MANQEYNGWTNYETWAVNLWLTNSSDTCDYWFEQAAMTLRQAAPTEFSTTEQNATNLLADILKAEHEEAQEAFGDETPHSVFHDLLNGAMGEVNWHEIAGNLIADVKDNEQK